MLLLEPLPVAVDDVDIPSVCFTVSTSPQTCTPDPVGIDSVSGSAFCGRVSTSSLEAAAGFVQFHLEGSVKLTSRNLITRSGAASFCCGVATGVGDIPVVWATAQAAGTNSVPNTN